MQSFKIRKTYVVFVNGKKVYKGLKNTSRLGGRWKDEMTLMHIICGVPNNCHVVVITASVAKLPVQKV